MTALLLEVAVRSSALVAGAALVDARLRRRGSAAARHLLWTMTMGALLALPLATATLPRWEISIPVPRTAVPIASETVSAVALPSSALRDTESTRTSGIGDRPSDSAAASGSATALVLYAAGVLILFLRIALEPLALRRLTRSAHDVTDPEWVGLLEEAARQLRLDRPVRLLQSAADVMPMTFGTRRPTVIVPASAGTWTADRRRAVLLHELAHVARRDCFTQTIGSIACACYWPHPGVWWAARRLRVERELACDDRVIAAGTEPRAYAGHLLEIAHSFTAMPAPATALGMARARQLENRLLAIMDAARNRATLHARGRAVAIALAVAALVPVAALRAAVGITATPAMPRAAGAAPQTKSSGPADVTGSWEAQVSQDGAGVYLNFRSGTSSRGRTIPLAELRSTTGVDISTARGPVTFTSKRDAGTFTFDGTCRAGACGGTWTFEANPAFAASLAKRGIGAPTPRQQFKLAVSDIGTAYLDELAKLGYGTPDLEGLVRAADHGVTLDYLRGMADLGYKLGTLDALVQLRDHGVDPEFIRGLQALGYTSAPLEKLVEMRDHGVDPEFVRGLAALGYKGLPLDTLRRMRDHGVDPDFVRRMQQRGGTLTPEELIERRDRGGNDAG